MKDAPQHKDSNMAIDSAPERVIERFEELESRLAWQEDWLAHLDAILIEQARTIEGLERHCRAQAGRLEAYRAALEALGDAPEGDERAPHY